MVWSGSSLSKMLTKTLFPASRASLQLGIQASTAHADHPRPSSLLLLSNMCPTVFVKSLLFPKHIPRLFPTAQTAPYLFSHNKTLPTLQSLSTTSSMKPSCFLTNACTSVSFETLSIVWASVVAFVTLCLIAGPCYPPHCSDPMEQQPNKHLRDTQSGKHQTPGRGCLLAKGSQNRRASQESLPGPLASVTHCQLSRSLPSLPRENPTTIIHQASWLNLGKSCFYDPCH